LVRHVPQYPSWLYSIDRTVPRAYVVPNAIVEPNRFQVLGRLSTKNLDPNAVVFVEEKVDLPPSPNLKARVEIARYEHAIVKILASLSGPGLLVLADAFYPGWHAYVDGKEERILRANFFFRAVALSAGDHVVEFRYKPVSFQIGLVISLVTVFGLIAASLLLMLRRKRRG
ncbi:MAG: YfhO family protein, partial [Deltaproteobacteria bacterium]|nr:YfhO family protein [Deltaproteobacteria bacterium]